MFDRCHETRLPASRRLISLLCVASCFTAAPIVLASSPAQLAFDEVAGLLGMHFQRTPSATMATIQAFQQQSLQQPLTGNELPVMPTRANGIPGVVVFDPDDDGDLDIYVTNGPGSPNSLYRNRLGETGYLAFIDEAVGAGVDATAQDSTGACAGDLDNDGDEDLVVLGRSEGNRLFENQGNGTFAEVIGSDLEGGPTSSVSCSVGDIDGDGLLDIVVSNTFDYTQLLAIFVEPYALNHPNDLFRNRGALAFDDVSASSGIREIGIVPPGAATISWAVAIIDIDLDGDQDVIFGDDQGGIPIARDGGLNRGFLQIMLNDGSGAFTAQPVDLNDVSSGSWMGLGFGDLDCNGSLDIWASNFGDYGIPTLGGSGYQLGDQATRSFYGNGDGSFFETGASTAEPSVFGWGSAVADFDLDGDQDIVYHGGLNMNFVVVSDNPGVVLRNEGCAGAYTYQANALGTSYLRRNIQGVATGDLDRDGFPDVVAASNLTIPDALPLLPAPVQYGGIFDGVGGFAPLYAPTPAGLVWAGVPLAPGDLTVELNRGNANQGITVSPIGSVGLIAGAVVNRSGLGAVFGFEPHNGDPVLMPIVGGSSLASQHASEAYFGLGRQSRGTLEVFWPGGVRNRLYGVFRGENIAFPEIPCSYDGSWNSFYEYLGCLLPALDGLRQQGVVTQAQKVRFLWSGIRAYFQP